MIVLFLGGKHQNIFILFSSYESSFGACLGRVRGDPSEDAWPGVSLDILWGIMLMMFLDDKNQNLHPNKIYLWDASRVTTLKNVGVHPCLLSFQKYGFSLLNAGVHPRRKK